MEFETAPLLVANLNNAHVAQHGLIPRMQGAPGTNPGAFFDLGVQLVDSEFEIVPLLVAHLTDGAYVSRATESARPACLLPMSKSLGT